MNVFLDTRSVNTRPLLGRRVVRDLLVRTIRLSGVRVGNVTVSLAFVDRRRMQQANERYRRRSGPTDVLSFRYRPASAPRSTAAIDGEILLCPVVIKTRAAERDTTIRPYTERLVVHAMLHLLGFSHRRTADWRRMNRRESRVLGEHISDSMASRSRS